MEDFIKILKMTELELKEYVYNYLIEKKCNPIYEDGFVYAKGKIPILIVAHLDTIYEISPKNVSYDEKKQLISARGGLGGDDRCGVFAILKILEELSPCVLFTEQEEVGGLGAKKVVEKLKIPKVKYIIELDRHGNNDCVFYDCGNLDFIKYIESFGFETTYGIFSDISILGPAWNIAAVNLSSGYYDEHTFCEHINVNELFTNIERVKEMIKQYKNIDFFDYQDMFSNVFKKTDARIDINMSEYDLLCEIFNYPVNGKKRILKNDK